MDKFINFIFMVLGVIIGCLMDLYKNTYMLGYQNCFKTIQMSNIKNVKPVKDDSHESK